jgi:lysophospholipase L1-like esterase
VFRKINVVVALVLLFSATIAQPQEVDPARFTEQIKVFEVWDKKNSFQSGAILFVGSSSIRMWATAEAFPDKKIVNRGFGGAHVSDVNFYFDSVVRPYGPSAVFLYAGDNDIGGGKSAERVFEDFEKFVALVEAESTDTRIHYLSIKPSKARWNRWSEMSRANQMIRDMSDERANVTYVDMATVLLNDAGEPRDVFVEDGLHLNKFGYQLCGEAVSPYLK